MLLHEPKSANFTLSDCWIGRWGRRGRRRGRRGEGGEGKEREERERRGRRGGEGGERKEREERGGEKEREERGRREKGEGGGGGERKEREEGEERERRGRRGEGEGRREGEGGGEGEGGEGKERGRIGEGEGEGEWKETIPYDINAYKLGYVTSNVINMFSGFTSRWKIPFLQTMTWSVWSNCPPPSSPPHTYACGRWTCRAGTCTASPWPQGGKTCGLKRVRKVTQGQTTTKQRDTFDELIDVHVH